MRVHVNCFDFIGSTACCSAEQVGWRLWTRCMRRKGVCYFDPTYFQKSMLADNLKRSIVWLAQNTVQNIFCADISILTYKSVVFNFVFTNVQNLGMSPKINENLSNALWNSKLNLPIFRPHYMELAAKKKEVRNRSL